MLLPFTKALDARLEHLRRAMAGLDIEALIVSHGPNLRYLLSHVGSAGVAVITPTSVELLVDARYTEAVKARQASPHAAPASRARLVAGSYDRALAECLHELGARQIGIEARHVSVATFDDWSRLVGATQRLVPTKGLIEALRQIKDEFELERLRRAALGLTPVAEAAFAAVRAGVRERDVAHAIEAALRTAGYERPAFDTIVASGPNAALPHHRAGDRILAPGDLVVLDFGGVLDGYCSDITRTVTVGPSSAEARRVYAAVLAAQRAAIVAVKPGVEATAVDAAARDVLTAEGLGEAFGHGTGHGLGLEVHEGPRLSRERSHGDDEPYVLRPGMVVTVEPGAYLPGWGGVRIEDDVAVTETGHEVLTAVASDLRSCPS